MYKQIIIYETISIKVTNLFSPLFIRWPITIIDAKIMCNWNPKQPNEKEPMQYIYVYIKK